jgi:probable HAF family extracellular repeat protein
MTSRLSVVHAVAAASALVCLGALGAPSYHVIDMGSQGDPYGINQRAQIAGAVAEGHKERAAKFREGRWKTVPDLGHGSEAHAIDAHDDLVGRIFQGRYGILPTLWPKHGDFVIIPLPYPTQFGSADAISPAGKYIVGTGSSSTYQPRCFSWSRSGTAVDLGTLGGDACIANAVNDAGQIAGQSNVVPGNPTHAFLSTGGIMRDLGTLPGGGFSRLTGLNSAGHGVGQSDVANGVLHAVYWDGDQWVDLGDTTREATGINDFDDVVGVAVIDYTGRAFLYRAGEFAWLDQLVDNGAGWSFDDSAYIDNGRVIIGVGTYQGNYHMYKLVPLAK